MKKIFETILMALLLACVLPDRAMAAALFTLAIAFLSIISRTLKVATSNPVESIKTE